MKGICINNHNQEEHLIVGRRYKLEDGGLEHYITVSEYTGSNRIIYRWRFKMLPSSINNKIKVI